MLHKLSILINFGFFKIKRRPHKQKIKKNNRINKTKNNKTKEN